MAIVFSAGNSGYNPLRITLGPPGNAKNVITVGASENTRPFGAPDLCNVGDDAADSALDVAFFSSRGPTGDYRIKPDLVAPGTHIVGGVSQSEAQRAATPARPTGEALACFDATGVCGGSVDGFYPAGQQWYTASSGTSHSTPAVAGAVALLRQWFLNQGLPSPSPAMTKAFLVNSARYVTGAGDDLPSIHQGMGLVDLSAAFDGTPRLLRDQAAEDVFTATGQQRIFQGTADASKPLRITLAWTDAPGPSFANAWVNDLDLAVTAAGVTYVGNKFSGPTSIAGGLPDRRNNLESVFLPVGAAGAFTVTVTAANIAGDGVPGNDYPLDQDFALVVTNACADTVPAVPADVAATSTGANEITVSWSGNASEYLVERATSAAGPFERVMTVAGPPFVDSGRSGGSGFWYRVRARSGCATSESSAPVSAAASGACLLAPRFAGLRSVRTTGLMTCGNALAWTAAAPTCGGTIAYAVHRGTTASFAPSPANLIATVTGTSYIDSGDLVEGKRYWYIVRAAETSATGQVVDQNRLAPSSAPSWIETVFQDDFDSRRPVDAAAHWRAEFFGGSRQLSIVPGCHWQSPTMAYKFGAPDACGGGYRGPLSSKYGFGAPARLTLGGDGASALNGFFIPPDAKATLRFRHWYRFFDNNSMFGSDGASLLYSTSGPDDMLRTVRGHAEVAAGREPYLVAGHFVSEVWGGNPGWTWSDTPENGALTEVVANADALANQSVWFAWNFVTADAGGAEEGYFLDDVSLELRRRCSTQPIPRGAPVRFRVEGLPALNVADSPLPFTVVALDASGQVATAYAGPGQVASNDPLAIFPGTVTFAGGTAQGIVQFRTAGPRALEVLDAQGLARGAGVTRVTAGPPASIRFFAQPPSLTAGLPRDIADVLVEDAFGNPVAGVEVTLSIGDNPGGENWPQPRVLSTWLDGRAHFLGTICKAGKGYTLVASAGTLRVTSAPFDVVAWVARTLAFILVFSRRAPARRASRYQLRALLGWVGDISGSRRRQGRQRIRAVGFHVRSRSCAQRAIHCGRRLATPSGHRSAAAAR